MWKNKKNFTVWLIVALYILMPAGCSTRQADRADRETGTANDSHTCIISIDCTNILQNREKLDEAKAEFLPENGWILEETQVSYEPGESAFDVLKRVCNEQKIHMASRHTPIYDSYYIEGINQIYEFDCGAHSGWTYSVNDDFPNYGCSEYEIQDDDRISWKYTCDLGVDVENPYAKEED